MALAPHQLATVDVPGTRKKCGTLVNSARSLGHQPRDLAQRFHSPEAAPPFPLPNPVHLLT